MDKQTILAGFNNHFVEFMEDIKRAFPNNKDIYVTYHALHTIRKANPSLICKIWKKAILQYYRDAIEQGDLQFFATKDYSSDFPSSMSGVVRKLDNFRRPLANLNESDKQKVIQYLQNLTKLNDLYFSNSSV